jgi:hypothetical protein
VQDPGVNPQHCKKIKQKSNNKTHESPMSEIKEMMSLQTPRIFKNKKGNSSWV